ncbi:nitrate- and nitrite sensing domain-containing protein [Streptomyces coelicoflavus]|uniref:nitrate- and nitrite sensing domain-containing protein n=1 Tax=Streptomyces coelicoflavus TaxID=285562 RepID=UPI00224CE12C|nr:nitrate- and nitrite sensing domain-containing protein [Streptomyces coelicoflavus]MCX5035124.1 nitrate- and nitrite sensing domain-containing protein [Streptomyces coelicoflavus]
MQGRFKRDGSASAEPEPQGGTGPKAVSSSPQHAQNPGQTQSGDNGERAGQAGDSAAPGKQPPAKPAKGSTGPGPRIALRNWRISTRLVSLLALPVVAATSLGALRINQSMDDIQQLENMKLLTEMTKQATELAAALQEERDQSAGPLAHGSKSSAIAVKGDREQTDRALKNFLDKSEQIDAASKDGKLVGVRDSLVGIASDLNDLTKIRSTAYKAKDNSTQTVESYHRLITHLLDLSQDMAEATSNPDMIQRTRALSAFSSAKEYASIQRAVLAAALPANNTAKGKLAENDRLYAQSALQSQTSEIRSFTSIYGDGAEDLLKPITEGNPVIEASDQYAGRALGKEHGLESLKSRSYQDWLDDSSTKIQQMKNIELKLLEDMEQQARELRNESEQEAIISGVLILLVLGVSLVGAFVVARSMIRSLRRLEDTATKVAQDRLPELVKQLSETDPQDVDTSVESVGVHSRDEIGRVAAAFDDVHREAVRLAAEQALLRGNVNAMFTNLSRRSQGLIQRQLSLISELESREADPDQLSSLFKLDHLATRMRRNGENLLVLAGEEPGRRWTRPVPLVDVLRAAASEVEQYERIELASVPTTEVAGRVVNDLVHLLAELLENATSFSSPQTKVKVTGHALPDGRVLIEIHDTGIGLSPEDLAAINERLASPPTVDVSVSRRMGLFVVGRLSQRHGIRIQLRPSDSGGTTALVMLPVDVAQGGRKPQPKPGQPGAGNGGPVAAQASAGVAAARRGGQGGGALGGGGAFGGGGGALGAGAPGGRLGAGQGPRAALPGRDAGGRPGAPGGPRGPQSPAGPGQQNRPAPAGAGAGAGQAPGAPQGLQAAGMNAPQGNAPANNAAPGQDMFGGTRTPTAPPQRGKRGGNGDAEQGRRPQLPPRGGPRAELPGGNPQPRVPSWSDENAQPPVPRASLDAPRGHDEPDSSRTDRTPRLDERQGPGATAEMPAVPPFGEPQSPAATAEFARPDFDAPAPRRDEPQDTGQFAQPGRNQYDGRDAYQDQFGQDQFGQGQYGQGQYGQGQYGQDAPHNDQFARPEPAAPQQDGGAFVRSDVFGGQPAPGNQAPAEPFAGAQGYDNGSTGQHDLPGRQNPAATGQFERPQVGGTQRGNDFGAPRPPAPQRPAQPEPASQNGNGTPPQRPGDGWALPPASGPGDGRTPLYDTLETNWFHGDREARAPQAAPAASPEPQAAQPQTPAAPQRPATSAWRSSPNDDLVRQAERVRQPAAGGVTTSGLPRRVPRANLVPGTAQQQSHQSGPAVSRAPDDVRGRLTNLRRGIAQGRQAGTNQTGSYPRPTHQQER